MYLTQVKIPLIEAVQRHLDNPYQWHQALWKSFHSSQRPFLYRVDVNGRTVTVLMESETIPIVQPWGTWQVKAVPPGHLSSKRYHFKVRAFPSVKKARILSDGSRAKQGVRIASNDPEGWITRKASENGFEIEDCRIDQKQSVNVKGSNIIGIDYSGILKVTDDGLFQQAVRKGIGPAKYAGFGMMLLAKA